MAPCIRRPMRLDSFSFALPQVARRRSAPNRARKAPAAMHRLMCRCQPGFAVYAINPKQLDRLRDRISVAGAKDDRRDARVAAAGLCTDPQLFRPVQIGDPATIELRE